MKYAAFVTFTCFSTREFPEICSCLWDHIVIQLETNTARLSSANRYIELQMTRVYAEILKDGN
jgi:hypothetical protein